MTEKILPLFTRSDVVARQFGERWEIKYDNNMLSYASDHALVFLEEEPAGFPYWIEVWNIRERSPYETETGTMGGGSVYDELARDVNAGRLLEQLDVCS